MTLVCRGPVDALTTPCHRTYDDACISGTTDNLTTEIAMNGRVLAGELWELTLVQRQETQRILNVSHWLATAQTGAGVFTHGLASFFFVLAKNEFKDKAPPTFQYRQVVAKRVTGAIQLPPNFNVPHPTRTLYGEQAETNPITTDVGMLNEDSVPSFVAVAGRKRTAAPSKLYRGSVRVSGLTEPQTEVNGQFLTDPAWSAWQTSMTNVYGVAMLAAIITDPGNDTTMTPVVWSPVDYAWNGVGPDPALATRQVLQVQAVQRITSQVSRKRKEVY